MGRDVDAGPIDHSACSFCWPQNGSSTGQRCFADLVIDLVLEPQCDPVKYERLIVFSYLDKVNTCSRATLTKGGIS
jgi:hypothetical protein